MDFHGIYQKYGHALWLALLAAGAVIVAWNFTGLIGSLLQHVLLWTIIAGVIYVADWNTLWLADQKTRFAVALVLSAIWGIWATHGLMLGIVLFAWDVVVIMCVFSLSAVIWPNKDAIARRIRDLADGKTDPRAALREAASAGADAVKGGVRGAIDETGRAKDYFSSGRKPAA